MICPTNLHNKTLRLFFVAVFHLKQDGHMIER